MPLTFHCTVAVRSLNRLEHYPCSEITWQLNLRLVTWIVPDRTLLNFFHNRTFSLDCKTVRIFAYSSTREQPNKRSGARLKIGRACGARALPACETLPLPDFKKKNPIVLQSTVLQDRPPGFGRQFLPRFLAPSLNFFFSGEFFWPSF